MSIPAFHRNNRVFHGDCIQMFSAAGWRERATESRTHTHVTHTHTHTHTHIRAHTRARSRLLLESRGQESQSHSSISSASWICGAHTLLEWFYRCISSFTSSQAPSAKASITLLILFAVIWVELRLFPLESCPRGPLTGITAVSWGGTLLCANWRLND